MIDETTADWRDVRILKELLLSGKKLKDLKMDAACLSHVKYPMLGLNSMHYKRKRYRTWLLDNAYREYKRELDVKKW